MKLVILAIGIPGSGKTTLLTPLATQYGLTRISRDDIRRELTGDPLDRSRQDEVWREADTRMRDALENSTSVILDSTFAERRKRSEVLLSARAAGAERIIGIIFITTPKIAKERNQLREHKVADEVIDILQAQLESEPPLLDEGFDALYTSDQLDALEAQELANLI